MADDGFKLPGSSYTEIAKIIRAYGHAQDEASLEDVASRAAVDKTFVSRNNAFLVSMGILLGGKKKSLTPGGRELSQALDHELIEQIQDAWRVLVEDNEFMKKIISAVRIRNGMDPSQLRAHIAYTAGVPKKPIAMTGANAVIDVLRQSGLLAEQDGKIVAGSMSESKQTDLTRVVAPKNETANQSANEGSSPGFSLAPQLIGSGVQVSIQINLNCTPDDIPKLAVNVRELLEEIRSATNAKLD